MCIRDSPYCVTTNADGSTVYVTNTHEDTVSVIDAKTQKVTATIRVGGTPEGIAYDNKHQRVYVASWMDNALTVIDAKNNKVIDTIKTGSQSRAFGQFIATPIQ